MRVLDPIYQGISSGLFPFGKFLKDYKESSFWLFLIFYPIYYLLITYYKKGSNVQKGQTFTSTRPARFKATFTHSLIQFHTRVQEQDRRIYFLNSYFDHRCHFHTKSRRGIFGCSHFHINPRQPRAVWWDQYIRSLPRSLFPQKWPIIFAMLKAVWKWYTSFDWSKLFLSKKLDFFSTVTRALHPKMQWDLLQFQWCADWYANLRERGCRP